MVFGFLGTFGLVAGVAGATWFRDNINSVGRVEAGECVDVGRSDGVSLDIRDCNERHRAEVVPAAEVDSSSYDALVNGSAAEFCFSQPEEPYRSAARHRPLPRHRRAR